MKSDNIQQDRMFAAWLREASLASYVLVNGINQLHESASAPTGVFSVALFNLSIGFERLGKLVVMLDYLIESGGSFLSDKQLKEKYGHDLEVLFNSARDIVLKRKIILKFGAPDDPIQSQIMSVLSQFANKARYYNLNYLGSKGTTEHEGPEAMWLNQVAKPILARHYSSEQEARDKTEALMAQRALAGVMILSTFSPEGAHVSSIYDSLLNEGKTEVVASHAQFYIAQIVRFFVEVFSHLEREASGVPHFSEILRIFYNSDGYLMERKSWELL